MKKIVLLTILTLSTLLIAQQTDKTIKAGAGVSYLAPTAELGNRFLATPGFYLKVGKSISETWTWSGTVEYFKFDKINSDMAFVENSYTIGAEQKKVKTSLTGLDMSLTVAGVSVVADYKVFDAGVLHANLSGGFGIYNWVYQRAAYVDSVFYVNGATKTGVDKIDAPAISQKDWSGGFRLGLEIVVDIYGPLKFNAAAYYKNIIAELFMSLKLGQQNVASFQMGEFTAGVSAEF